MNYNILNIFSFDGDNPITEFRIKIEENKLLVIYGRHINGYFIALPEMNVSCEAMRPEDIRKNTMYLAQAGIRSDYADAICRAINEIRK